MKKILNYIIIFICSIFLVSCSNSSNNGQNENKVTIGISMPTKYLQRWSQDGANMKKELEKAGYNVDLQYASGDIPTQVSQIENMISNGDKIIVIAPIDGGSLGTVLQKALNAKIPVIAYDRLILNSKAIKYYATFDNYKVGQKQGEYIEQVLDLKNAKQPQTIEIFAGDPGDNNARFFFKGAMDVLQKYINSGKLVVKSGQVKFDQVATPSWSTEKAQNRMDTIIAGNYANGTRLSAVLCSNDSTALGVENALAGSYTGPYPVITGQDCDIPNIKNLIIGKQAMDVFKDTRLLASKVVLMVDAIVKKSKVEINDTSTYNNGTGIIPTYLCQPQIVTKDNYNKILIDSGYYKESQLK